MTRITALLSTLLLLAACTSPEQRANEQAQREIAACEKAGYVQGTPAFDDCRYEIRSKAQQRRDARVNSFDGLQQVESNRTHSMP